MKQDYEFIKDSPDDLVFRVENEEIRTPEGIHLFSFDGKTVLNFFRDFLHKLTEEQIEIFKNLFKLSEICYKKRIRKKYPSDITKEQFEQIRSILESGRKKTAPRKVDLYEVFCALLYLLKSGYQWRMLSEVFPKWNTFY